MDTNMEDVVHNVVGQVVPPPRMSPATEPASIPTLDGWIESLMTCKQLAEVDVQRLCEKVCQRGVQRTSASMGWFAQEIDHISVCLVIRLDAMDIHILCTWAARSARLLVCH
jgi:hypothetical protein